MGVPKLYTEQVLAKFRPGTVDGIAEVLTEGQTRAEFMRHWIEYGIAHQRRAKAEREGGGEGGRTSGGAAPSTRRALARGAGNGRTTSRSVAPVEGTGTPIELPDAAWDQYIVDPETVRVGSHI